jgi:murein DD-endopeptidase MepM/ murein hydrolase activator NlpD
MNRVTGAEVWSKIIEAPYYTALANTPQGLIIGEFDTRLNLNPYNGLKISKDIGKSWNFFGLQGRGITDIAYSKTDIFVTTYYGKDSLNGLFVSKDKGISWQHLGQNFSAASVAATSNMILLGSYTHGLWVSNDDGKSFIQKIGTGLFGPTFLTVRANAGVAFAATAGKTYKSIDNGETWQEIAGLSGKQIKYFEFLDNKIYAATSDIDGIYKSEDSGNTWGKLNNFGNTPVGGLLVFKKVLYAAKPNSASNIYSIFKSDDFGNNWENTGLNSLASSPVANVVGVYANPSNLFATVSGAGVYKAEITEPRIEENRFLKIPWEFKGEYELQDRIVSYFDHEYPLLGYSYKSEPAESTSTTLNFLNKKASQPEMYYSTHSGIDFRLSYGTMVKAPARGVAEYYYCKDCGNSIKIDHQNGYQTIYMHLQSDGLVTKSQKVVVEQGDQIGKVGLTGNTSGPHLHFEVTADANNDGLFANDFPHGRVDPFGWLTNDAKDPWYGFGWSDTFGMHVGQQSKYLWETDIPATEVLVIPDTNSINYQNKKFDVTNVLQLSPYTFEYKSYGEPQLSDSQSFYKYVPNTSFLLEAKDTTGNQISNLQGKLKITLDLSTNNNINADSQIKLFFYNSVGKTWEALESTYDSIAKTLVAETTHLSQFAAFEIGSDTTPPATTLNINKTAIYTIITLSSADSDLDKIFYSINESDWLEYAEPLQIAMKGTYLIKYRSSDKNGNYEITKNTVVEVNEDGWTKNIKISPSTFRFSDNLSGVIL